FRNGASEAELADVLGIGLQQVLEAIQAQVLTPLHIFHRGRQQLSIRRDIQVRQYLAVRKSEDLVPPGERRVQPHQGDVTVQVAQTPQAAIAGVESQVADAGVLDQHARLAGLK